jgi:hypothetical protein
MYGNLSLSCCFDTIEDRKSDDLARTWILKLLDVKLDVARFVASRRGKGRAIEIIKYLKGSFNMGLHVKFDDDGPDAVIRFPKPGHFCKELLEEKVINEVHTMQCIREKTTIPVPEILDWGLTEDSPHALGPFVIMNFVEGTLASSVLQKPMDDEDGEWILDPDVDLSKLDTFYQQVAGFMLQLSRLTFSHIGAVSRDPKDNTSWTSSMRRPVTYNMNELGMTAGYPIASFPTTTFKHASDYFRSIGDIHLTHLKTQRNIAFTSEEARARYIARHRYLQLIAKYYPSNTSEDSGPFVLYCDDLRSANMIVDPDTMRVRAVIDWEFTNAMPAQFTHDPPWWLLLSDPGTWVDSNQVQDFRDLYEPQLKRFLAQLRIAEDEDAAELHQAGQGDKPRLSERMLASWESGHFWFDFASRKSYDVDTVYWRVLHGDEDGDALDLLDESVRRGVEGFVEEKMKQYDEYNKDREEALPKGGGR